MPETARTVYDACIYPTRGNGIVGTVTALAWCVLTVAFLLSCV